MGKLNLKAKLMDKGERYALIAGGGIMLLLTIVGIVRLSDAPNTDAFVSDVNKTTTGVTTTLASTSASVAPLPEEVTKPYVIKPVKTTWANNLFFDPIAPPDNRRINPIVLGLIDMQADFHWAKILAYDIRETESGPTMIGVLKTKAAKGEKADADKTTDFINELQKRKYLGKSRPKAPMQPMGPMGPVMGEQRPPGPMGSGPMGRPMGPRGPGGEGRPQPGAPIEQGARQSIEYVPLDPEKLEGYRFAWTIYPQRMVVIYGAFPYKAQIEEIQKALRLEKPMEVFDPANDAEPQFRGFVIERQILLPDGKVDQAWHPLDVASRYGETIYPRKFGDVEEDPKTLLAMLHEDHDLTMPLPILLDQKYAAIKLPAIQETIRKQMALTTPPSQPKAPSRFDKGSNPFRRTEGSGAGAAGQPNLGGQPGGIAIPKGRPRKGMEPMGGMGTGASTEMKFDDEKDAVLVRVIDNDIEPGRQYQYRIKMRMQNPNWVGKKDDKGVPEKKQKYDLVSRPSDADVEVIEGPWYELNANKAVSVPREEFMFATDPPVDGKGKATINLNPGQGVLQIQRWLPVASVGSYKEPVADWVVADVIATRGTYLGGKQFVNLPIWSSEFNRYILREVPAEATKGKTKEPKRGVVMDPTKPGPVFAVVDVEGGSRSYRPAQRTISEDTATEILLLDENGTLQVRSSLLDRAEKNRIINPEETDPEKKTTREGAWLNWIGRTEKDTNSLIPNTGEMGKGKKDFD